MDCENVDIYPVGWADLVGHKLEAPRQQRESLQGERVRGDRQLYLLFSEPIKKERRKPVGRKKNKRSSAGAAGEGGNVASTSSAAPSPTGSGPPSGKGLSAKKKLISPSAAAPPSLTPPPPVLEPQTEAPTATASTEPQSASTPPKVIPRLVDSTGTIAVARGRESSLDPSSWSVDDVAHFLEVNECSNLVENFAAKSVDGRKLMALTKPEMMELSNKKIGPCLKVENLLNLMRAKMNPAQARYQATMHRKST